MWRRPTGVCSAGGDPRPRGLTQESTMSVHPFRQRILQLLHDADVRPEGDRTGGRAAWDPRVHDEHFYGRILAQGSLGLGESYMDGWWDVDDLDAMLFRL